MTNPSGSVPQTRSTAPATVMEDHSDDWVDRLLPFGKGDDRLFDAIERLHLRDGTDRFQLGALDQAVAALILRLLRHPASPAGLQALVIQLPRGRSEFAIAMGLVAHLARIYSRTVETGTPSASRGSTVVIAMDTAMQRRLSAMTVEGVNLAEGLGVHRVRSDGRIVSPGGEIVGFRRGSLLYLNTRVGWPSLRSESGGVAIIDRTTFGSAELFARALDWVRAHRVAKVIVISDIGDEDTASLVQSKSAHFRQFCATSEVIGDLTRVVGVESTGSILSTNTLLAPSEAQPSVVRISAPDVERLFRRAFLLLRAGNDVLAPAPYPFVAARRMVSILAQLVGSVGAYDRSAALDHRTRSLRSLHNTLEANSHSLFTGPWHAFVETSWPELREVGLQLHALISDANPKAEALHVALDRLRRDGVALDDVIVRVGSEAARHGLIEDLANESLSVRIEPWSQRLPWRPRSSVEILPGLPPQARRAALWTREAERSVVLAYGWEHAALDRILEVHADRADQATRSTLEAEGVGGQSPPGPRTLDVVDEVTRGAPVSAATSPVTIDISPLTMDLEALEAAMGGGGEESIDEGAGDYRVKAVPVELDPGGVVLWVAEGATVETLVAGRYYHRDAMDLRPGDRIIVPRGTGRESLFQRLVDVKHRDEDVRDLTDVLSRWRRACRTVLDAADGSSEAEELLQAAGLTVTGQLAAWASGDTIAPQDPEDIRRMGELVGDEWLTTNWRRISMIAKRLRGLHISIGHRISAAMQEVAEGSGPNLIALANELGNDASEILDEFEVATVRAVLERRDVRSSMIGTTERLAS